MRLAALESLVVLVGIVEGVASEEGEEEEVVVRGREEVEKQGRQKGEEVEEKKGVEEGARGAEVGAARLRAGAATTWLTASGFVLLGLERGVEEDEEGVGEECLLSMASFSWA